MWVVPGGSCKVDRRAVRRTEDCGLDPSYHPAHNHAKTEASHPPISMPVWMSRGFLGALV